MKITTQDCRTAIDQYWPDFKHAYATLGKQKWTRVLKIKDRYDKWVRYFTAFEDQTPKYGYVETWLVVTETHNGLVVRHRNEEDCALLRLRYKVVV